MPKTAQIAFSGLSGASDLCAALAIAGQRAGVEQTVAFWGTEPVIEARRQRCEAAGIATAVFPKKQGFCDREGQAALRRWAEANRDAEAFILHYPAAFFAVRKALRGMRNRPVILALEHHPNILKRPHEWLLSALMLWLGDGVVYNTKTYLDDVRKKLGLFFRGRKTAVIANGIELDRYQAPASPKRTGELVIGMSGRMMPVKDYQTLLRAFAEARRQNPGLDARLELAGDGPMRPELEALARELGIADRAVFLGLLPFGEMVPRMRSWDLFVLSTHGETQPLALMEAMACGLPCLATAAPGVVDVICSADSLSGTNGSHDSEKTQEAHSQNGLLVPIGDAVAMTAAILDLAAKPEKRTQLAAEALKYAREHFSSTRMWNNFQNYIAQVRR